MRPTAFLFLAAACTFACPAAAGDPPLRRDWQKAPAVVTVRGAKDVYAVSDPHGGFKPLVSLLRNNGLVDHPKGAGPADVRWTGGRAVLIVNGDVIDKGEHSVEVVDMLRNLQRTAPASGGRVVVTMGNHEAEFLADPANAKAMGDAPGHRGIGTQLVAQGVKPADVAAGTDAAGRGQWLRDLPFGVRVKNYFFVHAGDTQGMTVKQLSRSIQRDVDAHGFAGKAVTGPTSVLESRNWYERPEVVRKNAEKLGVDHIVMGHDATALGGDVKHIVASPDKTLVKIDAGMGVGKHGKLLHVDMSKPEEPESLNSKGRSRPVF